MDRPKFSPSEMSRLELCPASNTKEAEVFYFAETHGILGVETGSDAHKGRRLHTLLKEVPFSSKRHQMGTPYDVGEKILELARSKNFNLTRGDIWFCFDVVRRRDSLIENHLSRVIDEFGGVTAVEFEFDAARLRKEIHVDDQSSGRIEIPFSGIPDVQVSVTDLNGKKHVLVVDYRTGFSGQQDGQGNRQLASLAALASREDPTVETVGVSLIARNNERPDEISLVMFEKAELQQARAFLETTAGNAARLRAKYEDHRDATADDSPSPELEKWIQQNSRVGDHCVDCKAKICCQALRSSMERYKNGILEISLPVVAPLRLKLKELKGKTPDYLLTVMKPSDVHLMLEVAHAVTEPAKLFKQVREEAEEIVRQLAQRGHTPAGVDLKEGARQLKLKEKVVSRNEQGIEKEVIVDTSPEAVFRNLKPLLKTGGLRHFMKNACEVNPTMVRAMLADQHLVAEGLVYDQVLQNLGPKNPFEMRPNKPTVVLVTKTQSETITTAVDPAVPLVENGERENSIPGSTKKRGPRR